MAKYFAFFIFAVICFGLLTGFDVDNAVVPREEIRSGGPPKDGIPALLEPKFVPAHEADFLKDGDQVMGVALGNKARAYPVNILNWHEAVNDTLSDQPLVVTFWPLTQSGVVYSRNVAGRVVTFGISGRLYKSNVLLYDHQTESLWSQLMSKAISGPRVGLDLNALPSLRMSWKRWRRQYPHTDVLSPDTGYARNYTIDPYQGYYRAGGLMFPVGEVRTDLSAKARVMGISIGDHAKAYPLKILRTQPGRLEDRIGRTAITIAVSREGEITAVQDAAGRQIPHMFVFWFAWQAFHPDTAVFSF